MTTEPNVFLSFRGEDVRQYFVSHLVKELKRKTINTFIDENIERGRPINEALFSAIKKSRVSIVVFTINYPSSTWCLDELVQIHKRLEEQTVIPIFHNVDPSDVRKQTGEFGRVFVKTCGNRAEDDKRRWMRALKEVANLAGEVLQNWPNEAVLIEQIVNVVSKKLVSGTGATNAQCSYSQSLRRNTKLVVVDESRIQEQSAEVAHALVSHQAQTGSNSTVDKSALGMPTMRKCSNSLRRAVIRTNDDSSPIGSNSASTIGPRHRSESQGNTNVTIGKDKRRPQTQASLITQALIASITRGYSSTDWIEL